MKLKIALIRHGETERAADEKPGVDGDGLLSENGKKAILQKCEEKAYPALRHVYTCGAVGCRETAALIYPFPAIILKELDVFDPEGLGRQAPDKLYAVGTQAERVLHIVGAEMERKKAEQCALISHKIVIFEILRRYCVPRSRYEAWDIPLGGGYLIEYDTADKTVRILEAF